MMNCITNDLIQRYIDAEVNSDECVKVKTHIVNCELCRNKLLTQEKLAIDFKETLNLLTKNTIEIPPMAIPVQLNRRRSVLRMRLAYALAAACVLISFVMIFPKHEKINQDEIRMLQAIDEEFDANLPVSEQKMVINVVDPTGKITEFYLD